jgi:mRNA interferase HigB
MRLISTTKLLAAVAEYKDSKNENPIKAFILVARTISWNNLIEMQSNYPTAEAVGGLTVVNIRRNRYRLILRIDYEHKIIYFRHFLTHAEYAEEKWKDDPYY